MPPPAGTAATSAIFSFCSGSSVAECATIGAVALPESDDRGYNKSLAAGSVAAYPTENDPVYEPGRVQPAVLRRIVVTIGVLVGLLYLARWL